MNMYSETMAESWEEVKTLKMNVAQLSIIKAQIIKTVSRLEFAIEGGVRVMIFDLWLTKFRKGVEYGLNLLQHNEHN